MTSYPSFVLLPPPSIHPFPTLVFLYLPFSLSTLSSVIPNFFLNHVSFRSSSLSPPYPVANFLLATLSSLSSLPCRDLSSHYPFLSQVRQGLLASIQSIGIPNPLIGVPVRNSHWRINCSPCTILLHIDYGESTSRQIQIHSEVALGSLHQVMLGLGLH